MSRAEPSPTTLDDLRVALVHDWIWSMAGGERVLEELSAIFPGADLHCLVVNRRKISSRLLSHRIRTSFLSKIPGSTKHYRMLLPLFPIAVDQIDLRDRDLVISSDSACVKGVLRPSSALHVCYCHTPMRYAWDLYQDYLDSAGSALRRLLMRLVMHYIRLYDYAAAQRVDAFFANSRTVARRILATYRREATVIHPPVRTEMFRPSGAPPGDFDLLVSRLVAYKRIDLAVEAYRGTGLRLVVIGEGPEARKLRRRAPANVEFRGEESDDGVLEAMRGCRFFLLPGVEDFGIAAVEAQACGRPVVAFGKGGGRETVLPGVTGVHFDRQSPGALMDAVRRAESIRWDPGRIRAHAETFSAERFRSEIRSGLSAVLAARGQEWS